MKIPIQQNSPFCPKWALLFSICCHWLQEHGNFHMSSITFLLQKKRGMQTMTFSLDTEQDKTSAVSLVLKESHGLQDPLTDFLASHEHSQVMPLQNWGRRREELSSTWGTTGEYNFPPISLVLWSQVSQANVIILVTSYIAQCPSLPERQLWAPITCEPLCKLPGSDGTGTSAERIEVPQWKLRAFEHLILAFLA